MEPQSKSHKAVYTIVDRQRDGKKYWLRIGTAFENRDGSLNLYLDAVPTNGTLQVREAFATDARSASKAGESSVVAAS